MTNPSRTLMAVIAAAMAVTAMSGCTATPPLATTQPSTGAGLAQPATRPPPAIQPGGGEDTRGRHRGEGGVARAIPADFPAEVPLPPGTVLSASGAAGRWSVLLAQSGPADQVQHTTVAFYVAAGFAADSGSSVHRGTFRIDLFAANRDHIHPNDAELTIAVART